MLPIEFCIGRVQHDWVQGRVKGRILIPRAAFLWGKTKLSRNLQGWQTDGRGCTVDVFKIVCQEEGDCRMNVCRLSGHKSEDISWSYELADTEQTQGDECFGKGVSMLWNFMPCYMRWMLEVSICSEGNWSIYGVNIRWELLNTQESHLVASELPFSGDHRTAYERKDPCVLGLLLCFSFDICM